MADGSSLPEIKISELPVATAASLTDQLEANQAGVSRSITPAQIGAALGAAGAVAPGGPASGDLAGSYPGPTIKADVALSGNPTATTQATSDNSQRLATTAFIKNQAYAVAANYLPLAGGTLTGPLAGTLATFSGSIASTSGPVLVGGVGTRNFASYGITNITPTFQAALTGIANFSAQRYTTGANGPVLNLSKSGSATVGTHAIVAANDGLGQVSWNGSDGTQFVEGAFIRAEVDGTPATNVMPSRLVFSVAPTGSATPAEAMRISNTKAITLTGALIGTTATFSGTTTMGGVLVGYGTAVPISVYGGTANATPAIQIATTSALPLSVQRYNTANGPTLNMALSRGASAGAQGLVAANDLLGQVTWDGSDGTNLVEGASIKAFVDGTPGTNDMPTRLVFNVALDGTAAPAEAMRIDNTRLVTMASSIVAVGHIFGNSNVYARNTTAIPAGGTTGVGYLFSSTANFGTIFGSGAPTASAARGSLYLRSDGGGPYVNTDGATTWTPVGVNKSLQTQSVETGAVATGTTIIPLDDTIPQQTEGDQYMTLTITPLSATSKLIIEVAAQLSASANVNMIMALFQDATANALAAVLGNISASSVSNPYPLRHVMTSGTTSATTFKVRAGPATAATTTFNGTAGGRIFGGVMASSIVITEVLP